MPKKPKRMGQKVTLGYAWYALGVLFLINLINYVDRLSIGPALEHIRRDFDISDVEIGMIAGAFMLVYAVISLPMGWLSDRGSRTKIIATGAFVWSIATTLSGFCRNFWLFFAARAGVGSGEGIYAPSGNALIADYFPKRLRNTAIAIFMSAMILGGAIAYMGAGVILLKTDRFDAGRVEYVLLDEGQKSIDGWEVTGVDESEKMKVRFMFEGPSGTGLAAVLSKPDEKKEADFHSNLFNINYTVKGDRSEAAAFIEALNARVAEREVTGLERNTAPIAELPHTLKADEGSAVKMDGGTEYLLIHTPQEAATGKKKEAGAFDKLVVAISSSIEKIDELLGIKIKKDTGLFELPPELLGKIRYQVRSRSEADLTELDNLKKVIGKEPDMSGEITEMVFYGIMSKDDKLALEKVSDAEQYTKTIGALAAQAEHYHRKSDNWRWIFWILGPPGVLFALLAWFLKEPLKGGGEDFLTEEEAKRVEESGRTDYTVLIRTPSIVIMILSNILVTYCVGGLNIWLFPFVERYKGVPSAEAAVKFGPIVIAGAVAGVIISGILADRLQKVTQRGNNIILVVAIFCSIPFMYFFMYTESYYLMIASITLCIFFLTAVNGPMNALLMSLVEPRLRAILNGIHILLIHVLGDALSPIIIGHYSETHNLQYALAMLPLFLVAGAVGFGIAGIFVPNDLDAVEKRMKAIAGTGGE